MIRENNQTVTANDPAPSRTAIVDKPIVEPRLGDTLDPQPDFLELLSPEDYDGRKSPATME